MRFASHDPAPAAGGAAAPVRKARVCKEFTAQTHCFV
jgi:hypothetical protein